MPYQSRGFWCCDYCKLTLDSFEDAKQHEVEECHQNPNKAQQQYQQYYPPQHRVPAHLAGYYPPTAMAPLNPAAVKQEGVEYESDPRLRPRSFPLMALNEASNMNTEDTVACQSLEVFEASPSQAADMELRAQYPSMVAGRLGIRCIHCSEDPNKHLEAFVFPETIDALADNVQMLCSRHLGNCGAAPSQIREVGHRAAQKKQQNDQERGSPDQEDQKSRRALQEWCFHFCQRLGIVDKSPHERGLFFSQHPREQYAPGRSVSGMGGPLGPDPLAPTPLARRRERSDFHPGYEAPFGQGADGFYREPSMHAPGQEDHETQQHPGQRLPPGLQQPQMASFDLPTNFPFFQDPSGTWSCKYCSQIHPQYRDPQSMWSAPNHMPPPGPFIDQHLSMCRAYHQAMGPQPMFPGPPQSHYPYMHPQYHGQFGPPLPGWEGPGPASQGNHTQPIPFRPHGGPDNPQMHAPFPGTPKYGEAHLGGLMPQSRTPVNHAAGSIPENSDAAARHAIEYLAANEKEPSFTPGTNESDQLVLEEDKLLLTDYFFHLMKQLRLVRFSEADRKTRGGKREKIKIGFGGLQCIHCADANNSRKFFWSNVDRLANSFAEIPGHVLKCRHCPQQTKDALYQLKQLHPEQMARLPRGSQKVFFRRMWRRLHDEDPHSKSSPGEGNLAQAASTDSTDAKSPPEAKQGNDSSPGGTTGSDESILLMQRSTQEAAKALADSTSASLPPSPTSRVLLAIPEDKEWLSDTDCFIRRQIEVFCASKEDVKFARYDRKFPIHEGQVGIRCIHCALARHGPGARGSGVAYPFSISGIYESVREFQRLHLDTCDNLPTDLKARLSDLKGSTSLSSVLRKYYVLAGKALGLEDTRDGIRAGADSVPLGSQAAFAFSEGTTVSDEMRRSAVPYSEAQSPGSSLSPLDNRKRKPNETPTSADSAKRPHSHSS